MENFNNKILYMIINALITALRSILLKCWNKFIETRKRNIDGAKALKIIQYHKDSENLRILFDLPSRGDLHKKIVPSHLGSRISSVIERFSEITITSSFVNDERLVHSIRRGISDTVIHFDFDKGFFDYLQRNRHKF